MRLLGVGGAHIDRRGQVTGSFVPGASNPGTWREEVGGGAFNALRNAVARGATGTLFSARGGDAAGMRVAEAASVWGIADLSVTFLDRATPSYTALLDRSGELIAGLADMSLYDLALGRQFRRRSFRDALAQADALLIDANIPAEGIERIAGAVRSFAVAVSPAKVVRLARALPRLDCVFMNVREAAVLAAAPGAGPEELVRRLPERGLRQGIVTDGAQGAFGFDGQGAFHVAAPHVAVADVTGAGDALAGAMVAALLRGLPLRDAVCEGVAAATLTVESDAAVIRSTQSVFNARLRIVPPAVDL